MHEPQVIPMAVLDALDPMQAVIVRRPLIDVPSSVRAAPNVGNVIFERVVPDDDSMLPIWRNPVLVSLMSDVIILSQIASRSKDRGAGNAQPKIETVIPVEPQWTVVRALALVGSPEDEVNPGAADPHVLRLVHELPIEHHHWVRTPARVPLGGVWGFRLKRVSRGEIVEKVLGLTGQVLRERLHELTVDSSR
jgi:hypothetical protein